VEARRQNRGWGARAGIRVESVKGRREPRPMRTQNEGELVTRKQPTIWREPGRRPFSQGWRKGGAEKEGAHLPRTSREASLWRKGGEIYQR